MNDKKTFDDQLILQYFTDTCLYSFEDHQDVFSRLDDDFDIATQDWLSGVASVMKTNALDGLSSCLDPMLNRHPNIKSGMRKAYPPRDEEQVKDIIDGARCLLGSKSSEIPHQWYISECISLVGEVEQFQEYLAAKDYKKMSHYLMIPLLRHAQLVEHAQLSEHTSLTNKELESLRESKQENSARSKGGQAIAAKYSKAIAEVITHAKKLFDQTPNALSPWQNQGVFSYNSQGDVAVNDPFDSFFTWEGLFGAESKLFQDHKKGAISDDEFRAMEDFVLSYTLSDLQDNSEAYTGDKPASKRAFYTVVTDEDNAPGLADKTGLLVNSDNQFVTAAQLQALDSDNDGELSGGELSGLKYWQDLNENGYLTAA